MSHPYREFGSRAFWRTGVAAPGALAVGDVFRKKFDISPGSRIATAGSCFAQHVGARLRRRFRFVDAEPAPPGLPPEARPAFGYGLFSARYGNVYSAAHLRQLLAEALGLFAPADRVWSHNDRFYDPYRPTIEPGGFGSAAEVQVLRAAHLEAIRDVLRSADTLVFTLGMTETWRSALDGAVYQVCPGTTCGVFDATRHVWHNGSVADVHDDLVDIVRMARSVNPGMTFVLTVSPVPLTATASRDHVLLANSYSKSVLRAACGQVAAAHSHVDYFPAYELVTAPHPRGTFFDVNLRTVTAGGVELVMSHFFAAHPGEDVPRASEADPDDGVICDDEALEAGTGGDAGS